MREYISYTYKRCVYTEETVDNISTKARIYILGVELTGYKE